MDAAGTVLSSGPLVDCADVRAPARYAGIGLVSVLTIDTRNGTEALDRGHAFGVLANGDLVHSTADRVYVGTSRHQDSAIDVGATTELHAFDPTGRYLSSASVPGDVRGRYALSSQGGYLRVFTETSRRDDPVHSENHLVVLAAEGLTRIGSLTGIWPDEQLRNVRWFADEAVTVTEGQDPHSLHSVDLSSPTSPRPQPLELANFSGDLAVVGDHRLVGTGADATPKDNLTELPDGTLVAGPDRRIQASAFDLGDGKVDRVGAITLEPGSTFNRELPLTYLPDHRLVLVGGNTTADKTCDPTKDCRQYLSTAIGVGVDDAGRLRRVGAWVGPEPVLRVLSLGDRLVARTFGTVQLLDPGNLRVLGSLDLPEVP